MVGDDYFIYLDCSKPNVKCHKMSIPFEQYVTSLLSAHMDSQPEGICCGIVHYLRYKYIISEGTA